MAHGQVLLLLRTKNTVEDYFYWMRDFKKKIQIKGQCIVIIESCTFTHLDFYMKRFKSTMLGHILIILNSPLNSFIKHFLNINPFGCTVI